jgi:ammonia channel protein AmtB
MWTPTGWLTVLGFKDFCGSSALHLVGGSCAIGAALIVGKRINRFPKPGAEHTGEEEMRFTHHNTLVCVIQ